MKHTSELVSVLKKEAQSSPVANAVFHMWALRKRARNIVTLASLSAKMKKEGFTYTDSDYVGFLKSLSALGIGRLELNSRGKVRALRDITTTLQSIGHAACGQTAPRLIPSKKRNVFKPLYTTPVAQPVFPERKAAVQTTAPSIVLGFNVNGKMIKMEIPEGLTAEEIASLVLRFKQEQAA